jgi:GlcNAc-P-P-Und epimerase
MGDKQRILVTGSSGFVGSSIVREVQTVENFEVIRLNRKESKTKYILEENCENQFLVDISDYQTLHKLEELEKVGVLIHTAGLAHQFGKTSKEDFWKINVQGTENVCKLAEKLGVKHFILISSVSVYGNYGNVEIDETFNCNPSGFYAESKVEAEKRAIDICKKKEMGLTILRLGTVIGEGDRGNVARLITNIDKRRFFWIGNGSNKKSLIYKGDVARGVLKLVEAKVELKTEIYNLTSEAITMKEVVEAIQKSLGRRVSRIGIPKKFIEGIFQINKKMNSLKKLGKIEKTLEKWFSDDVFSGKKFSDTYSFQTQTSITEAIDKQVKYYLEQKNLKK